MTTAYTSLLGLALPVQGELQGTWGDTVNNSITSLLDTAVAGTTSITTDADITLTTTTGASNQARQAIILWNPASGTTTRNITAPAQSKIYTVINASGGTQSIVLRGVGPTTGVTIVKGESAVCAWNGSDFIKVSNTSGSGTFTNLTVTGSLTLSGGTANQVQYLNGSKVLTGSANMTFDGTTLTVNDFADSSLTTGRVVYTTTGGNLTSSANLLYSGTDLTVYGLTVGRGAGAVSTNTAVGASALALNTTGATSTAIGENALGGAVFTGSQSVAIGNAVLYPATSASFNTGIGYNALRFTTTGSSNVAVGTDALKANTTASNNTAIGYQAGYTQSGSSPGSNVWVGYQAGYLNSTGGANTGIGQQALQANTTAAYNAALGYAALYSNTTGGNNTALGTQSLQANTTASNNVAVGYQAGYT